MRASFISDIFNKNPDQLDLKDVVDFFNVDREETASLEFKSGDVTIEDLFKEISAFLNTEGGLIIVGAPRETKIQKGKRRISICNGELTYSKFRSKDWLFQKIASNISPAPTNLIIKELISSKGNVYLIDIPQSTHPPHQANADGRYFLRFECEAKPAPHGLIKALFDKRRRPTLTAEIDFNFTKGLNCDLTVSFQNASNIPADKVGFLIDVYNVINVKPDDTFTEKDDDLGRKFTMINNTGAVLVRVISANIEFSVVHKPKKENFLVMAAFWSLECDFDYKFWTISPSENKIINEGNFTTLDPNLVKALELLKENID